MIYDLRNGLVWRIGHGFASWLDNTILKKRRSIQSQLDILKHDPVPNQPQIQLLANQAHRLTILHQRHAQRLHITAVRLIKGLFSTYFLPDFNVSQKIQTGGLPSKAKRQMISLHNYKYEQRLKAASLPSPVFPQRPQLKIISCNEAYTTKTCSGCATIIENVGAAKIVSCTKCGLKEDRDAGAARKILLKALFADVTFY